MAQLATAAPEAPPRRKVGRSHPKGRLQERNRRPCKNRSHARGLFLALAFLIGGLAIKVEEPFGLDEVEAVFRDTLE